MQSAIAAQDEIIQTAQALKAALMQQLFTETPGWKDARLGDVAAISSGGTPSRERDDFWKTGTIPWVKTGEINYGTITDTEEKITEAGLKGSSAKLLPAGTLLMAMYGQGVTRGRVAMLGINATLNQACAAIIPYEASGVLPKFLYYFFQHNYERIRQYGHGANQKNLSGTIIKLLDIAFPSLPRQEEIVEAFEAVDEKIAHHRSRKRTLEALFRTLLHELMTGARRVRTAQPADAATA